MELQLTDFLDEQGNWHCIQCTACCVEVRHFEPCLDGGDGVCRYLNDSNDCEVYGNRPEVCRIKWPKGHSEQLKADSCLKCGKP